MLFIADIYCLKLRLSSQLWWHISVTQPQEAETGVQEIIKLQENIAGNLLDWFWQ